MKTKRISQLALVVLLLLSSSLFSLSQADQDGYKTETVAEGLPASWAMTFLPNSDILLTQRAGALRVVRDGELIDADIAEVPGIHYAGQGGLLDVMLDQNFSENNKIYLSYSHGKKSSNTARLVSAALVATENSYKLEDFKVLFEAKPSRKTSHHYAARIAQLDDGSLLFAVGDGYNYREDAQTLDNHFGKIIRINTDGTVPQDNPFIGTEGAAPEIYSLGHRNQQGLTVVKGVIYEHEHGPKGGDEVNIIEPGKNYGWPIATFGIDYNGATITPYTEYEGMQSPLVNWTPSIAPSSLTEHNGFLYVSSLAERSIRKLDISGEAIKDQGKVFSKISERLRDIVSGPDGHLYVLTDGNEAKIIKIVEDKQNEL
ncbi:MAG: PQQ-dependent sugar dehydrogenase [Gammaproteobacteria bacterium]|nr:PQQ-dependent sugar dehydrogenase [Gammaproteobacteria bacterium]